LSLNPGGTERLVVEIIRRCHSEMPMAVCCLDEEGTWGKALKDEGVQVRALNRIPGFHPLLGRDIERMAEAHQANVIHCHQYSPFIYSCLARVWHPSLKILFTEHGRLSDAPPSMKRKVANRVFARLPHRVFAVSENLKQHIVAEGFPPGRVGVVYNGIDIGPLPDEGCRRRVRTSLGIPDGAFAIATVARLDPVKDLDVLLRAVASLARRLPAILLIAGDGSERRHLEDLAASLEAQDCIRFLGHRDDVRDVLAGCDAYANSSISEGISLTILEAMAVGLPVVATRVGGTPEILDETCSRLVPSRDAGKMAAALAELAFDPAARARLGLSGRQRVEERFTLERMIGEYKDAYYRAVA
jgi:L-malate glycosyltransferase